MHGRLRIAVADVPSESLENYQSTACLFLVWVFWVFFPQLPPEKMLVCSGYKKERIRPKFKAAQFLKIWMEAGKF